MPAPLRFHAPCPRGLESLLADELRALGATILSQPGGGVRFEGDAAIGMAANLRRRLGGHKAAICRLKDTIEAPEGIDEGSEDDQRRAHSFAKEVVRRQLSVNRLLVIVRKTNQSGDEYMDAENILNRINFPICGRN